VPRRRPSEAVRAYVHPLQQTLSCVSDCILRPSGYEADVPQSLTLSKPVAFVASDSCLYGLSFIQSFKIARRTGNRWKITTLAYYYSLETEDGDEIIAYHWHPNAGGEQVAFPHLHVGSGARCGCAELLHAHLPTRRIAFEDFIRCIITEFHVEARPGWERVLERSRSVFRRYRAWP